MQNKSHMSKITQNTKKVQNNLFYLSFFVVVVRQTHWFLDHSRGWKPFTNLFIWKYKYKIILSTSMMWETPIHIVFYNEAPRSRTQRPERCDAWDRYMYIYLYRYIHKYIYKKNSHYQSSHQFILKYKSKG